eukprot:m.31297 g.31297  ORF g.31297 m.31297 type:complete len:545 (+) comp8300_c0_seq2:1056-2690(+)
MSHFRTASFGANMGGVMCSYNAVNGVPSCANDYNNNKILRGMFNFTGMVVSDCGAVGGIQSNHHFTNTTDDTCYAALSGGTDNNCGNYYVANLQQAINDKRVPVSLVDTAVSRVLTQIFKTGLVETSENVPFKEYNVNTIDSEAHRQLALDSSMAGITLLKNDKDTLPLKAGTKVAVIGPHFNSSTVMLGNYYGDNDLVFNHTPLLALKRRDDLDVVGAAMGCNLTGNDTSGFAEAITAATESDVVLLFLGLTSGQGQQEGNTAAMEREGFDRTFLTLPSIQMELYEAVSKAAADKLVVVVLLNSGGLAIEEIYSSAPAIVEAFYPGELGGDAIAGILMGDRSPAGRLPTTVYTANYTRVRNITDMEFRSHTSPAGNPVPGVTHRFLRPDSGFILFPFGFGLTYTSFSFKISTFPKTMTTMELNRYWPQYYQPGGLLPTVTTIVTNTGTRTSDVAVLGFISCDAKDFPYRRLFGFERVTIAAKESQSVTLTLPAQAFTTISAQGTESLVPTECVLSVGGEPDGFDTANITISGALISKFELPKP